MEAGTMVRLDVRSKRRRRLGRRKTISKLFYYAHLTIRAEWSNGVFWTPTSKGPLVVPDPANAADLVSDHVEHSLGLIAWTNAKTDPVSYTVSGCAEAYYGDGRQAALFLNEVRTEKPDHGGHKRNSGSWQRSSLMASKEAFGVSGPFLAGPDRTGRLSPVYPASRPTLSTPGD